MPYEGAERALGTFIGEQAHPICTKLRKLADELFDELRINVKLGKSITGPNLKRLVEEFEEHSKATGKQSNRDLAIIALLKRMPSPTSLSERSPK